MTGFEAKEARNRLGLSQSDLGAEFHVSAETVSRMEKKDYVPGYWRLALRAIKMDRAMKGFVGQLKDLED